MQETGPLASPGAATPGGRLGCGWSTAQVASKPALTWRKRSAPPTGARHQQIGHGAIATSASTSLIPNGRADSVRGNAASYAGSRCLTCAKQTVAAVVASAVDEVRSGGRTPTSSPHARVLPRRLEDSRKASSHGWVPVDSAAQVGLPSAERGGETPIGGPSEARFTVHAPSGGDRQVDLKSPRAGHGSEEMVRRVYAHLGEVRHRSEVVEFRLEQHLDRLGDRLRRFGLSESSVSGNVTAEGAQLETNSPPRPKPTAGEGVPESGRPDSNRRRPAWEAGILPLNYARGSGGN